MKKIILFLVILITSFHSYAQSGLDKLFNKKVSILTLGMISLNNSLGSDHMRKWRYKKFSDEGTYIGGVATTYNDGIRIVLQFDLKIKDKQKNMDTCTDLMKDSKIGYSWSVLHEPYSAVLVNHFLQYGDFNEEIAKNIDSKSHIVWLLLYEDKAILTCESFFNDDGIKFEFND